MVLGGGGNSGGQDSTMVVLGSICFFLASTTSLTFFNKWFLNTASVEFHFPFAIGAWHQMCVFIYTLAFENVFLAKVAGPIARKPEYFKILCPIGIMCAIDWGSSNFSLTSVPLSLYEMIKSTCPMWTLVISIMVGLQPKAALLISSILVICLGTYFSVTGTEGPGSIFVANFPLVGASVLLFGSIFSGIKTVTSQFVMQKIKCPETGKADVNGVTMMFYLAPMTAATLGLFSFIKEREALGKWLHNADSTRLTWAFIELSLSAVIAFSVTISGFILTRKTSALTYSVVKIAQRVGIVILSTVLLGDHVGFYNGLGFAGSLVGIAMYNYYEIVHKHKDKKEVEAAKGDEPPAETTVLVDKTAQGTYGAAPNCNP